MGELIMYKKMCMCGTTSYCSAEKGRWICPNRDCMTDLTESPAELCGTEKTDLDNPKHKPVLSLLFTKRDRMMRNKL